MATSAGKESSVLRKRRRQAAKERDERVFESKIRALIDCSERAEDALTSNTVNSDSSDGDAREGCSIDFCQPFEELGAGDTICLSSSEDATHNPCHPTDQTENKLHPDSPDLSAKSNLESSCSVTGISSAVSSSLLLYKSSHLELDCQEEPAAFCSNPVELSPAPKSDFPDCVSPRNQDCHHTDVRPISRCDSSSSSVKDYTPLSVEDFMQDMTVDEFSNTDVIGSGLEVRKEDAQVSGSDDCSSSDDSEDSDYCEVIEWEGIADTAEESSSALPTSSALHGNVCDNQLSSRVLSSTTLSENSVVSETPSLRLELAHWATDMSITHDAVDKLLEILSRHGHQSELPRNAKTLLKTPRNTKNLVKEFCGGQYWYNGISNGLMSRLSPEDLQKFQGENIAIDIFIDGISPYKSVKLHICAIAGCIVGHPEPFIIALWCGSIKEPDNVDEFFSDFISEAQVMMKEGFKTDSGVHPFTIDKYIADAMARVWFLKTKPPQGFFCCERCTLKGERVCNRTVFDPTAKGVLRTDDSLANQDQKEHHVGDSPLLQLGVRLKSQVPLEPMHNVYLGAARRFFSMLLSSKRVSKVKLPNTVIESLSSFAASLKPYFPSDFNRKPRPLVEWRLFKASEYHRLSLYDAFLLLDDLNEKKIRDVHRLFACAIRILSDPDLVLFYRRDADVLLKKFVTDSTKLFGPMFNVFNIHCLTHLADETALHGSLNNFGAWKYESYLANVKKMLRAPGRSLQQIVCRYSEKSSLPPLPKPAKIREDVHLSQPHSSGPSFDSSDEQFKHVAVRNLGEFRVSSPNDVCFVSTSDEVCVVRNITRSINGEITLICNAFQEREDFFTYPVPSTVLGICKVKSLGGLKKYSVSSIKRKAVLLPVQKQDIVTTPRSNWMDKVCCLCLPMMHQSDDALIIGPLGRRVSL